MQTYIQKHLTFITTLAGIALLAACSKEPSQQDIETLMQAQFNQANQNIQSLSGGLLGDSINTELHSIKKLNCKKEGEGNAYLCDVEVDATAPLLGRTQNTTQIRLVEAEGEWHVLN